MSNKLLPQKNNLIGKILTRETVGCDVDERKHSGTDNPYIIYGFDDIRPFCFCSGRARKTMHSGIVDIYSVGNCPNELRDKVMKLLGNAGIKVAALPEGYTEERREWTLRIQFRYESVNNFGDESL